MIVVVGPGGQVGTALRRAHPDTRSVGRAQLDLAAIDQRGFRAVINDAGTDVEAVVNCAAYTAVDRAESEGDLARRVNGDAVGIMAGVCAELGIPFVTYSTDYVFGGDGTIPYREDDPTDPVNAYGESKLAGEQLAMEHPETSLVVRTSWVISGTHPNFVATMLRLTGEGKRLSVVDDQWGRPTVADDLAIATLQALNLGVTGLLHLANEGPTTWFELARASVVGAGRDPGLIQPCRTEDYPTPARRPSYSVLDTGRASSFGVVLPAWEESLPRLIRSQLSTGEPPAPG